MVALKSNTEQTGVGWAPFQETSHQYMESSDITENVFWASNLSSRFGTAVQRDTEHEYITHPSLKSYSFSPRHKPHLAEPILTRPGCLTPRALVTSPVKTPQIQSPDWPLLQRPQLGNPPLGFPNHSIGIRYFALVKLATKYNLESAPNHSTRPARKHNSSRLSKNAGYIMKNKIPSNHRRAPVGWEIALSLLPEPPSLCHTDQHTLATAQPQLETTLRCSLVPNSGCKVLL